MYKKYQTQAEFIVVYIEEAHAADSPWKPQRGIELNITQPKTENERIKNASKCVKALGFSMPVLIDDMKNSTEKAYSAGPDRLFIVDIFGKIAFTGGKGPKEFDPLAMEQALKKIIYKKNISAPENEKTPASQATKTTKNDVETPSSSEGLPKLEGLQFEEFRQGFLFKYQPDPKKDMINGILCTPRNKTSASPAIIINHGKGGNARSFCQQHARDFLREGYVVIASDLTHGQKTREKQTNFGASDENNRRILACLTILENYSAVDSSKIFIYGNSMGAFATVAACTQTAKIRAAAITAGGLFDTGDFNTEEHIEKIQAPLLILHGFEDQTVDIFYALALKSVLDQHKKISKTKFFDGVGHSVMASTRGEALLDILEFFKEQ